MIKATNREKVQGYVYSHNLAIKTVQNTASANYGKDFISGTLDVATDDAGLNIVTIHYTYVAPTTKAGTANKTFNALKQIIESGKTILVDGIQSATKVKIDTSLAVNDFYTSRNGQEELVSAKRNEGGFVTIVNELDPEGTTISKMDARHGFEFDFLMNGFRIVEADEEKYIPKDYAELKGCVFNFRGELQPVVLVCKNAGGMKYFESLDASSENLVFTKVRGLIENTAIQVEGEEAGAFGEPLKVSYTRNRKEWVVTWSAQEPYEIGESITVEEIKEKMTDRQTYLADVKRRQDEYEASKATTTPASSNDKAMAAAVNSFNF